MERFFDKTNPRKNRKITVFGKPTIKMAGKELDLRKMIHKNAENTGIYEQIELYGLNPIQPISIEETVMDYTAVAGDLRSVMDKGIKARELFKNLPLEIRQKFNHDPEQFMREGPAWLEDQHKQILKKNQELKQQIEPQKGATNVTE